MANLFLEGQEADGLLNAAQGDVEGVEVFGLAEEAVKADLQEVQLVQEGGLVGLMFPIVGIGQGPAEMLEVAGEGRGGEAILGGQVAQGQAIHEGAVDLGQGGVSADGAALVHGELRERIFEGRTGGRKPPALPSSSPPNPRYRFGKVAAGFSRGRPRRDAGATREG